MRARSTCRRPGSQLAGRHDDAAGQQHHPVGQCLRLVHVMGGQQDSRSAGRRQFVHEVPGVPAGGRIE